MDIDAIFGSQIGARKQRLHGIDFGAREAKCIQARETPICIASRGKRPGDLPVHGNTFLPQTHGPKCVSVANLNLARSGTIL